MQFQNTQVALRQILQNKIIQCIPVEETKRSKLASIVAILFYASDYLLMFTFILSSIVPQMRRAVVDENTVYVGAILKVSLTLFYIVFQWRFLLILNKVMLGINFFLFPLQLLLYLDVICVMVDWFGVFVWGMSLELRKLHFDSRLEIEYPILKQAILYCVVYVLKLPDSNINTVYNYIILVTVLIWFVIDYCDLLYEKITKEVFLMADFWLFSSAAVPLIYLLLEIQISFLNLLRISAVSLLVSFIFVLIPYEVFDFMPSVDINKTSISSEYELLEYFMNLDRIILSKNQLHALKFIIGHKNSCKNPKCFLIFNEQSKLKISHIKLLSIFFEEKVRQEAGKRYLIQKYLIFRLFDSSSIYRFLKKDDFFFKRESFRKIQEKQQKVSNKVETKLPTQDDEETIEKISEYIEVGKQFWLRLLRPKIDCEEFITDAIKMVQITNQLAVMWTIVKETNQQSYLKYFRLFLLGEKQLKIPDKTEKTTFTEFKEARQDYPMLTISAEHKDFTQILYANTALVRQLAFSREQIQKKSIQDFLDEGMKIHHNHYLQTKAKYGDFEDSREKKISCIFIKNKFGYLKFFQAFLYTQHEITGNKWKMIFNPTFKDTSILVVNTNRGLIGMNQGCCQFKLNQKFAGFQIREEILIKIIRKKSGLKVEPGTKIFESHDFEFSEKIKMKLVSHVSFDNTLYYYLFEIKQSNQLTSRSTILNETNSFSHNGLFLASLVATEKKDTVKTNTTLKSFNKIRLPLDFKEFSRTPNGDVIYDEENDASQSEMIQKDEEKWGNIGEHRQRKNYEDEDIREMRLWKGTLDFLENMKKKQEYFGESVPKKFDDTDLKILSEDQYNQFYKSRVQKKTPKQFVRFRLFFIISCFAIVAIYIGCTVPMYENMKKISEKSLLAYNINRQFQSHISLGSLTILRNYPNHSQNLKSRIMNAINQIEKSYSDLSSSKMKVDEIFQVEIDGQSFQKIENKYRLFLDEFLHDEKKSESEIVEYLGSKIYPIWAKIREKMYVQEKLVQQEITQIIIAILCTSVIIILVLCCVYVSLVKGLKSLYYQLLDIFTRVKDCLVKNEYNKLTYFYRFLFFSNSLLDEEVMKYSNSNQEQIYRKKLINIPGFFCMNLIALLCMIVVLSYAVLVFFIQMKYMEVSRKMEKVNESYYDMTMSSTMVWVGLNSFPNNLTFIDYHEEIMYQSEREGMLAINSLLVHKDLSEKFAEFYVNFWLEDACEYFSHSECESFLYGSIQEGVSQMIAYLNRKFDNLMHRQYPAEVFRARPSIPNIITIEQKYLEEMPQIMKKKLIEEAEKKEKFYTNLVYIVLGVNLILLLPLMIGLCLLFRKKIFLTRKIQKLFTFMPYQALIEIKEFIIFANEKADQQIH